MRSPLLLLSLSLALIGASGCSTHHPSHANHRMGNHHGSTYRIQIESDADWFAVTLQPERSGPKFVLPDNPGIWIHNSKHDLTSVKFSSTTLHIHRKHYARGRTVAHNFYIESARPEISIEVLHGANGKVSIRSDCDAVTTEGSGSQTLKLKLCHP